MDRFSVEVKGKVFCVRDNMNVAFMPHEYATAIYFKTKLRAETIANIMNAEWQEFCANPE